MKTKFKMSKGVTLIELIIVMALVGIIFLTVGSMMNFSIKSNKIVFDEYQLQSDMRIASQVITEQVRASSAVFMLNGAQFNSTNLKDGWDYFALSDDKKQIVQYVWNKTTSTHSMKSLARSQSDLIFNLTFKKPKEDSLIASFNLGATVLGSNNYKANLNSEINAMNTVVIDDSGTLTNPAVALAYRTDDIPASEKIKVAVTMVLDCSGSMSFDMAGNKSPAYSGRTPPFDPTDVRMDHLHYRGQMLIDKFASMENVYVSIIPFSTNANGLKPFENAKDKKESLKSQISGLIANGGTNTGDGIRRSYYQHLDYNAKNPGTVLNYTILLVDGNPTYYTQTSSRDTTLYTGDNDAPYVPTGGNHGTDLNQLNSMAYIEELGNVLIKNGDVDMKTFVIGFTADRNEVSRAESIAIDHSSHPTNQARKGYYYSASDGQKLSDAFDLITDKILEDVWHIYGPNR